MKTQKIETLNRPPMEIPKKKISEIATRLKLEPQIREMYVEGPFDRDLYREALRFLGIEDVQVYPIETVDVPEELLTELKLTEGNRQRVQAAAKQLEKMGEIHSQVIFLIDADFDYIFSAAEPSLPLARTDGTAAEIIMWNKAVLERFFRLALARQNAIEEVRDAMHSVEKIACEMFLFRAAKEKIATGWKLVDVGDSFNSRSSFCINKYCMQVASKNSGHTIMEEEIKPLMEELKANTIMIPVSKKMHGHDVFSILAKNLQIAGFRHGCLNDPDELGRLMMTSLDWSLIAKNATLCLLKNKFGV